MTHTFKKAVLFAAAVSGVAANAGVVSRVKSGAKAAWNKQAEYFNVTSKKGLLTVGGTLAVHGLVHGYENLDLDAVKGFFGKPTMAGNEARGKAILGSLGKSNVSFSRPVVTSATVAVLKLGEDVAETAVFPKGLVRSVDGKLAITSGVDSTTVKGYEDRSGTALFTMTTVPATYVPLWSNKMNIAKGLTTVAADFVLAMTIINSAVSGYKAVQAKKAAKKAAAQAPVLAPTEL